MELTKEQKLLNTILNKAWEDNNFKEALLANPIEAIEALTGQKIKLPEGKTMLVKDQTDSSIVYLNIPPKPDVEDMELNEEQLDMIAGGNDPIPPVITDPSFAFRGLF